MRDSPVFVESGVLAAASSYSRSHRCCSMIARRFFLHAHKQRVRIGAKVADGKAVADAGLEHRIPVVKQEERVDFPVGHVNQLRTIVAFRSSAVEDVPLGQCLDEGLPRRRVDQRLPLVRRRLAARQFVVVRIVIRASQFLAVSTALEDRHLRLRQVVGLRHDDRRDRHDERDATKERFHDFGNLRDLTSRFYFRRTFSKKTLYRRSISRSALIVNWKCEISKFAA